MNECTPQCKAMKLLVFGAILVLVRLFTDWDIWIVIGALLVIKAFIMFAMPQCKCQEQKPQVSSSASKRKRK